MATADPPTLINLATHLDECKAFIDAGDTIVAANLHLTKDQILTMDAMTLRAEIQRKGSDVTRALMASAIAIAQSLRLQAWQKALAASDALAPRTSEVVDAIQQLRDQGETDARIVTVLKQQFPDDAVAIGQALAASSLSPVFGVDLLQK